MTEDMPPYQKIRIENFLAEVAYFEGNTNRAIEIYKKTASDARSLPKEDFLKVRNNNLGQAYFQSGDFKKAIETLEADLVLYQGIEDNRLFARIRYMLAESYRIDRQYEKSKEVFNSLIESSKKSDDLEHLFRAYNGMGNLFNDQGSYKDAAQFYERAIDISGRRGMDEQTITCIANLGIIYSNIGDMKKALEYFSSALAFLEGGRTSGGIMEHHHGRMHLELGEIARINKNFTEAMDHLKEALEISQKHGLPELSFWIYVTMAKTCKDSGNSELMNECIKQATPLANSAEKKEKLGEI
jgi:tetratricopeptide (TPR) repeat protein